MLKTYNIHGLDCANCAQKIEDMASKEVGINSASINFINKKLKLDINNDYVKDVPKIIKKLEAIEDGVQFLEHEQAMKTTKTYDTQIRIIIALIIFTLTKLYLDESLAYLGYLLSYVLIGYQVLKQAFKNILRKEIFDENFLMSVATIGAFYISQYEEAVAVMLFYEVGELFQSYAIEKSRKSISSLMDIKVETVNVLVDNQIIVKRPDEVNLNDIMVVNVGERVALDGVVVNGTTRFDTSAISGESVPISARIGDEAISGVVNIEASVEIKVLKLERDSTLAKILELVENTISKKAPTERFITKFAKIYTPIVVALALLLFLIFQFIIAPNSFNDNLYRLLTFLVISCPCALVISIPLGMFAGIGTASMQGVLFKGGNYLEELSKVKTVVFDKTGTLTKGTFAINSIIAKDISEKELLKIAAHVEANSNHPIAKSIQVSYQDVIDYTLVKDCKELAGLGLCALYKNQEVLVGNSALMARYKIECDQDIEGKSNIHVSLGNKYLGVILIADEVRVESIQAIKQLRKRSVDRLIMLSGDRASVGQVITQEIGLDEGYYELLPQDKVKQMEIIMKETHLNSKGSVAFVGDGINDAPVLALADIGIAMGGIGSDAAIEASDIVLMRDNPLAINDAIKIAKQTMKIVQQNIYFSLGIKVIFLILSTFSLVNMWMGVFADVGVTLLAILNSMRLFMYRNNN